MTPNTSIPMPEYEIWLVDESHSISETHMVERADDFSALDAALALGPAHMIEIWRDGHHVLTIEKGALPLDLVWVACREARH